MTNKIMLCLALMLACIATAHAQNGALYDMYSLQNIQIYFGFTNWDYRMDTAKNGSEGYILADSVVVNGVSFAQCGVKYKGNSSYSASRPKNPLHIKLDYTDDNANYDGYDDLKLSNGFSDPSAIREVLAYHVARRYMDAPRSNFAQVYINGGYYGVMANNESIDKNFLRSRYYTTEHTFVKCNPIGGAGPGGGLAGLNYNGAAVSSYSNLYELQSDTGWNDLINLCDTLNNHYAQFNSIADVDRFLWMLAYNDALVNLDSYSGGFRQNYYLYRNHQRQWIPTIWDVNMAFGSFVMLNGGGGGGGLNISGMQTMTPWIHQTDAAWPLIYKLLNDPICERMYIAHLRTINNQNFANESYKTVVDSLRTLVDNAVQTDPNSLFTYSQFQQALSTNISGGGPMGAVPGIYNLMDARADYLSTQADMSQLPPAISNVQPSDVVAFGSSADIRASVTNATTAYLGYRYHPADRFVRVPMYDDGLHNDGAANDSQYGASISVASLSVQYYIYAENSNAGMFAPEEAEHIFYTLKPTLADATAADLSLNETMPNNDQTIANEAGKYKDWIELYNRTNNPLALGNFYLSDDPNNLAKWRFPADAYILPQQHLLIWADDYDQTLLEFHTNFELNNTNDALYLSQGTAATLADTLVWANLTQDQSWSRCPDGAGSPTITDTASPRAANICLVGINTTTNQASTVQLYPNPATYTLQVQSQQPIQQLSLTDLLGKTVYQLTPANSNTYSHQIDLRQLPKGLYICQINSTYTQKIVLQ